MPASRRYVSSVRSRMFHLSKAGQVNCGAILKISNTLVPYSRYLVNKSG